MRRVALIFALAVLFALPAFSQNDYKAEVFGGYQYTRVEGESFNGWNAAVTGNVNNWLGITGDISGGYKSVGGVKVKVHNFLFGPTVSYNQYEKVKPFAHVLFGVSHASGSVDGIGGASDNAFAMALGGGLDVGVHSNVAFRLVQVDYLMTRFGSQTQNNARISTGIVFRF
ncbi:MAG TPA: hypothetical protein VN577_10745 [Terriglobales bacterium]|nr:hypothetical protein [Terriglobales bacterium]